jgi:hypothetical protein
MIRNVYDMGTTVMGNGVTLSKEDCINMMRIREKDKVTI